jgi:hypothetical protein
MTTRQISFDGDTTRNGFDGQCATLAPAVLLGQGGEAEVYDLGDGRLAPLPTSDAIARSS